jgi:hypothetical protein
MVPETIFTTTTAIIFSCQRVPQYNYLQQTTHISVNTQVLHFTILSSVLNTAINKRLTCFFFCVEQRQIVNIQNENATNNGLHLIYKYLATIWTKVFVSEHPVVLKCNLIVLYIYTYKL